jgi:hypothetical protein
MSCVARRWAGMGTTTDRPSNPALAKEMNDRLKELQSARGCQDAFLRGEEVSQPHPQQQQNPQQQAKKTDQQLVLVTPTTFGEKVIIPVYDPKKTRGF